MWWNSFSRSPKHCCHTNTSDNFKHDEIHSYLMPVHLSQLRRWLFCYTYFPKQIPVPLWHRTWFGFCTTVLGIWTTDSNQMLISTFYIEFHNSLSCGLFRTHFGHYLSVHAAIACFCDWNCAHSTNFVVLFSIASTKQNLCYTNIRTDFSETNIDVCISGDSNLAIPHDFSWFVMSACSGDILIEIQLRFSYRTKSFLLSVALVEAIW